MRFSLPLLYLFFLLSPSPLYSQSSKLTASQSYDILWGEKPIGTFTAKQTIDVEEIATHVLYNIRERKGYNSQASPQHQAAVTASGSRTTALQELNIPALIIHGKADPFIPFAHGQKMATLMPNVDSLWLNDMGHDIPDRLMVPIVNKIINHFEQGMDNWKENRY